MFTALFKGLDFSDFHCDVCEIARHTRVSFPISNKRSSYPFDLVHSSLIDDCTRVTWLSIPTQAKI